MKAILSGINAPLLTPMKDNKVDYETYGKLASYIIDASITGLLVCGSTGECANLSCEEKRNLLSVCKDSIGKRASIAFNATELNPSNMKENIEYAKKLGVSAISCTTPYYFKYGPKALIEYFKWVSSIAEELPVFVYNIPSNTGCPITPDILKAIAESCPNVVGIKDSSMDFMNLLEYSLALKGRPFEFITGNDAQIVSSLEHGATGAIVAFAGVFPKLCASIYQNYLEGNSAKANELQDIIIDFRGAARKIRPIASHKYLLKLNGFDVGPARFPILPLDNSEKKLLESIYEKYKDDV